MRILIALLLSFLQMNSFASVCTDNLDDFIVKVANCRWSHNEECPGLQNQYESLSTLSKARHLLKILGTSGIEGQEIRGHEIISYLEENHETISNRTLVFENSFYGFNIPRNVRLPKNFYKQFVKFIDTNYQDYFLRYVRIMNREIPWEEIQKLEKGLTLSELMRSMEDLSSHKCSKLMNRYGMRVTWKDVAREALDNHFRSALSKKRSVANPSLN